MSDTTQSDRQWISGGAHHDLVLLGDPRLREGGMQITDFTEAMSLFNRLVSLLRELNGAGLAAPQIGVAQAAIVVEVRKTDVFPDRPTSPLIAMANPRIVTASEDVEPGWEGCFSVPGLMGLVDRSKRIEVAYQDPDGQPCTGTYEGYLARVVQHEIDHLAGITFIDRMSSLDSLTTVSNYQKFHATKAVPQAVEEPENSR